MIVKMFNSYINQMKGGNADSEAENNKLVKKSKYDDYKTKPILFLFSAKWCGHCHHFMPTFEKLKQEYIDDSKIKIINIDEEKNRDLVEKYGVEGFPTLKLYDGKQLYEYTGGRDINNIREFVNKKLKK